MEDQVFSRITERCKELGFHKRGMAFFRHYGDGVLQVLKYAHHARLWPPHTDLAIGLFSLYGELEPQWLTERGCIPRYVSQWMDPKNCSAYLQVHSERVVQLEDVARVAGYGVDTEFADKVVFPFLNGIHTQEDMVNGMIYLDQHASHPRGGSVIWNDIFKFSPYLASGNDERAAFVMQSILDQHTAARESWKKTFSREQYEAMIAARQEEEDHLLQLWDMAQSGDRERIQSWLQENYTRNLAMARFLRKK